MCTDQLMHIRETFSPHITRILCSLSHRIFPEHYIYTRTEYHIYTSVVSHNKVAESMCIYYIVYTQGHMRSIVVTSVDGVYA